MSIDTKIPQGSLIAVGPGAITDADALAIMRGGAVLLQLREGESAEIALKHGRICIVQKTVETEQTSGTP